MKVRLHRSVEDFRAAAETVYRRDPVTNTVELTALRDPNLPADSVFLTVWRDSVAVGAAMQTPPYPLLCNGLPPPVIDSVATELAETHAALVGVRGVRDTATQFAEAWRESTGADTTIETEDRLYRLGRLTPPTSIAGEPRLAAAEDTDLLVDWLDHFDAEAFGSSPDPAAGRRFLAETTRAGDRLVLWSVAGRAVSMAALRGPVAATSRIGPVYTPVDHRGRGYGSAVTAAAARIGGDTGAADVVLFADLANPVSNSIYQRIGFVPVSDSVRIGFSAAR